MASEKAGQGFTPADLELVKALIHALDRAETAQQLLVEFTVIHPEPWRDLAARIEALLPPESPGYEVRPRSV